MAAKAAISEVPTERKTVDTAGTQEFVASDMPPRSGTHGHVRSATNECHINGYELLGPGMRRRLRSEN